MLLKCSDLNLEIIQKKVISFLLIYHCNEKRIFKLIRYTTLREL